MDAVSILRDARALITDPTNWTVGVDARSKTGRSVAPSSKRAVCWCAQGAVERVGVVGSDEFRRAFKAMSRAATKMMGGFTEPFEINDTVGYEATLQMFDLAIRDVEGT